MASEHDSSAPAEAHPRNPYASDSRWRHQESRSFARYAQTQNQARDPVNSSNTSDLASFLNKSRIETDGNGPRAGGHRPIEVAAAGQDSPGDAVLDGKEVVCGPLLNYRRMEQGRWFGSVLVVTKGGGTEVLYQPSLSLRRVGLAAAATLAAANDAADEPVRFDSERLYSDKRNTFWAFDISLPLEADEIKYEYTIPEVRYASSRKPQVSTFFVPAATESMRIMFHSCNGFSVGTDEDAYSGAPLWNDVMRKHLAAPFHVMVGGGDQIYNDGIRVSGPLKHWAAIGNPKKRRDFPFPETLRAECDDYYLNNYIRWYNTEPFSSANGQIPQLNIWDDHDIIDGFGSYTDHFMRCDVFRGIGGTAHKYYMLFQHHLPPPASTYTSDYAPDDRDPATAQAPDPVQLVDTFVAPPKTDPQYIIGGKPGPYVAEHSFNMYARLGARVALVGIDARTERTRHQVNYPDTYKLIFDRLESELQKASTSELPIKHLILLLGIPIAYPRLTWLENVLRSPLIGPIKFLHRRFGLAGGLFNHFDGSVDLLDDLDDHYTAKTHKAERAFMIEELQKIAAKYAVRVTILGGDVHLAALGRFYSNPKLRIPVEHDNRYMVNVVSSAIVNKPPPLAVANLLARRNKIHHLNGDTDETLLDFFDKDPGDSNKTANHNHCTMPSRNFAQLTENSPHNAPLAATGDAAENGDVADDAFFGRDGHQQLHRGELNAGTKHKSSTEAHGHGNDGSLDIRINVEIDQHSSEGQTQSYGLTVPLLQKAPTAEILATAEASGPSHAA